MKPVPQIPKPIPIVTSDGKQADTFAIYLKKMEAAIKDLQERVEALEAFHP